MHSVLRPFQSFLLQGMGVSEIAIGATPPLLLVPTCGVRWGSKPLKGQEIKIFCGDLQGVSGVGYVV
jgi:hypothetical protein